MELRLHSATIPLITHPARTSEADYRMVFVTVNSRLLLARGIIQHHGILHRANIDALALFWGLHFDEL